MWYVYELRNESGKIEYVGVSIQPKKRFRFHTTARPRNDNGCGYFFGRTDLKLNIVGEYNIKELALAEEGRLKILNNFEWTEKTKGYYNRKFTAEQIDEIKAKYIPWKYSTHMLAKEYNVGVSTIKRIINQKTYNEW